MGQKKIALDREDSGHIGCAVSQKIGNGKKEDKKMF